jgi:hypothetical protein
MYIYTQSGSACLHKTPNDQNVSWTFSTAGIPVIKLHTELVLMETGSNPTYDRELERQRCNLKKFTSSLVRFRYNFFLLL